MSSKSKSPVCAEIYAILGVPRFSSVRKCEKGYKMAIRTYHPDHRFKNGNEYSTQALTMKTIQLNNAIECIRNPAQKEAYDTKLRNTINKISKLKGVGSSVNNKKTKKKKPRTDSMKKKEDVVVNASPPKAKAKAKVEDTRPASTSGRKTEDVKTRVAKTLAPFVLLLTVGSDIAMASSEVVSDTDTV